MHCAARATLVKGSIQTGSVWASATHTTQTCQKLDEEHCKPLKPKIGRTLCPADQDRN